MKSDEHRPLSDDVAPRVDEARLARQWSAVSNGLASRPRRGSYVAVLAPVALVALALIAVLIVRPWRDKTSAEALAPTGEVLVLADGSRVTLSRGAQLTAESATRERVHLVLSAGTVDLDVTHVENRPFVVTAAGHDVTVLGTAFSVKLEPRDGAPTLSVDVKRGRVRVSGPSGEHVLGAGQAWSARVEIATTTAPLASAAPLAPSATDVAPEESVPPAPSEPTTSKPAPSESSPHPVASAAPVDGPRELLARATEARGAGRPRDAAIALDTLRKRHRSDPRAGLAAFELGRVRMDALHDPAGAAEAFADAVTLAPSAPFREDAEARRVEALDALPDRARCERARDAYLARYPSGLHTKQIGQRCKSP
ncbi:MAG: sigma factor regulatory protein FecR/PupR family protein [Labilithrix sp.]|nr:sigma factor regulatory protein FecR/PupR family protein [Labilithrix sp.]